MSSARRCDAEPFWRRKTLEQMSAEEWEALCDGCGNCCRLKLEDDDSGEVVTTNVACAWLDLGTCRCADYPNRLRNVPGCVRLTPETVRTLPWLPATCAYRRLAAGEDLEWWHPLVSGDPDTVHRAGVSVRGRVLSETTLGELEELIGGWLELEDDLEAELDAELAAERRTAGRLRAGSP